MGNNINSISATRFPTIPGPSQQVANPVASTCSAVAEIADRMLLARLAAGDRDSLKLLFQRYARIVHNIGRKILHDSAEAEDLVQEVFLYIHRKSFLYDPSKGSARSWIVQVAYTQALIRRRQLKSHGFYVSVIADKTSEYRLSSEKGANYDHTVEGFFGRSGWKKIWESLTQDQRETFRLHFFEGCTFPEIAEKLGQSHVNIRHHYYRGLEKLRKHANENDLNWP